MFRVVSKLALSVSLIGISQIFGGEIKDATDQIEIYKKVIAGDDVDWLNALESIPTLNFIEYGNFSSKDHIPMADMKEFVVKHSTNCEQLYCAVQIENLYRSIAVATGQSSGCNAQSPWIPKIRFWQKMQDLLRK